ncbi:hypothetical protein JCM10213_006819 [Rhodosporidiobolus nylandii]
MAAPPIRIVPLTTADIPLLAPVYQRGFVSTSINSYCYSSVTLSGYIPWLSGRFEGVLAGRERGDKVEVLVAKKGEEVVGYTWYSFVPAAQERDGGSKWHAYPEGADLARAESIFAKLNAYEDGVPEAHWALDNLVTVPEVQGQGIGKALAMRVIEIAKADGLPLYLESTNAGLPFYEKLGFARCAPPLEADDVPGLELLWPLRYEGTRA